MTRTGPQVHRNSGTDTPLAQLSPSHNNVINVSCCVALESCKAPVQMFETAQCKTSVSSIMNALSASVIPCLPPARHCTCRRHKNLCSMTTIAFSGTACELYTMPLTPSMMVYVSRLSRHCQSWRLFFIIGRHRSLCGLCIILASSGL